MIFPLDCELEAAAQDRPGTTQGNNITACHSSHVSLISGAVGPAAWRCWWVLG
jgi:hypothetical protein